MRSQAVLTAAARFRVLSGQPAAYLAAQLRDFASGVRANAVMSPIASSLSADDIEDVATYFATVETPFPPLPRMDETLVKKGEVIAESGIPTKGIPGCGSCHGAGGVGEPPTIPYLAGQYARYTALELQMWQRGLRRSSPEAMGMFSKKLDQDEIAAVAAYYQQAPFRISGDPDKAVTLIVGCSRLNRRGQCRLIGRAHRTCPPRVHPNMWRRRFATEAACRNSEARPTRRVSACRGVCRRCLFVGWLLFYFVLFIPRGTIG